MEQEILCTNTAAAAAAFALLRKHCIFAIKIYTQQNVSSLYFGATQNPCYDKCIETSRILAWIEQNFRKQSWCRLKTSMVPFSFLKGKCILGNDSTKFWKLQNLREASAYL